MVLIKGPFLLERRGCGGRATDIGRGSGAASEWLGVIELALARLGFFLKPPVDNTASLLGDIDIDGNRDRSGGSGGTGRWADEVGSSAIYAALGDGERETTCACVLSAFLLFEGLGSGTLACVILVFFNFSVTPLAGCSFALFVQLGIFGDVRLVTLGSAIPEDFEVVSPEFGRSGEGVTSNC